MDIKFQIGNGVGAGKLFERLFTGFINEYNKKSQVMEGLYAIDLNLSNSNFIWDIIISDNEKLLFDENEIINIIKNNQNNLKLIEDNLIKIIGNNWIGVSLKTYKNDCFQITTDYSYREFLENEIGESDVIGETVNKFYSLLNKYDKNRYLILALNTYDNHYTFRLLDFDKKFDKIEFKKNRKLSQYNIYLNNEIIIKVLYGKNQANPYQRGIWTHNVKSIEYFQLIKSGNYKRDNYFENAILSTIFK